MRMLNPAEGAPTATPTAYAGLDQILIGAEWMVGSSAKRIMDADPYTGQTLLEFQLAGRDDVDAAYAAAQAAQRDWELSTPSRKQAVFLAAADIMRRRHDEIIDWLIRESGSTVIKAEIEYQAGLAEFTQAAFFPYRVRGEIRPSDTPGKENRVYRQALGVVAVISPWNFPLVLTLRSVAPAIALGNAVVLKPASDTPVTGANLIAKIFEEAGLPSGVLNTVVGSGSEIGDYVVEHPTPALVSFTGSTPVGKRLAALATGGVRLKRVALELGGNGPFVVLDDANVARAAKTAVFSRFLHSGQICMSTNRIIVDDSIYEEFVDAFVAHASALTVGDPRNPATIVGPVINQAQLDSHLKRLETARDEGARQVLGGEPNGLVLPPWVFADYPSDGVLFQEESFGPIVPVVRAFGEQDALRLANDNDLGLSSAVFTGDVDRGVRFAQQVQAGMTHVNDIGVQNEIVAPFGGEKNSGLGRFNDEWIIEEFTRTHWISVQHTPAAASV